jgi:DNA-binding LacI/PurR family transcriptional regulator
MSTISKVAERAGVSRTTVSHVLNHADRVSKPLRERVLAAVEELGYAPNPQAQSLRTGRSNLIAVLIPDILNPFYVKLVQIIQTELEKAGLEIMIFNTDVPGGKSVEHGREYLRQISPKRFDGILIADFAVHRMHEDLERLAIPAVFIGQLPNPVIDSVGLDDAGGAFLMGKYLAEAGHRRIAHITGPSFFEQAVVRRHAFDQGFSEHGGLVDPVLHYEGSYLTPSGSEGVEWLLRAHSDNLPDAIFFSNSLMAQGGLAALYDHGLKIPDDIAVASFGGWEHFDYFRPRVTRVGNDPALLATRSVALLLDRVEGRWDGTTRNETLPCILRQFDTA